MAVGAVADAAVKAVQARLGNLTGLLGLVLPLKAQVISMAWTAENVSERKAAVKYDDAAGMYAVVIIERLSSSHDVKGWGRFSMRKKMVKLKVTFQRAHAVDDVAREVCRELVNESAGDLVGAIKRMKLL